MRNGTRKPFFVYKALYRHEDVLIIVFAVAVLFLYMKWVLLVVLYPLQALAAIYRNHPSVYIKILAAPNAIFERIIGGATPSIISLHCRLCGYADCYTKDWDLI